MIVGFKEHGKDWAAVASAVGTKTETQIRSFYNNFKKKHNLDALISEAKEKVSELISFANLSQMYRPINLTNQCLETLPNKSLLTLSQTTNFRLFQT